MSAALLGGAQHAVRLGADLCSDAANATSLLAAAAALSRARALALALQAESRAAQDAALARSAAVAAAAAASARCAPPRGLLAAGTPDARDDAPAAERAERTGADASALPADRAALACALGVELAPPRAHADAASAARARGEEHLLRDVAFWSDAEAACAAAAIKHEAIARLLLVHGGALAGAPPSAAFSANYRRRVGECFAFWDGLGEHLLRGVARIQNDLPQRHHAELALPDAPPDGADGACAAGGGDGLGVFLPASADVSPEVAGAVR